jgi:transcriptional regulator with XRE-family HTH domain
LTNAGRGGIETDMHYTQLFRQLRVARNLSHEALARRAGCHRNTVINVERGRRVKIDTLAGLMEKMGYAADSAEFQALALLWLEAASGIPFSRPETVATARRQIAAFRREAEQNCRKLAAAVVDAALSADQISLLVYAARRPDVLAIIGAVQKVVEAGASAEITPQLQVAEDK